MRALAVGVCAAALALFAAVPAQATDQTLRTTIRQQEHQFKPDAKAFDKAVAKADTVQDLIATKQPAQQLAADAGNFSNAVSAQQASTKRVQRGQKVLVKALGEFAGGLNNYVAAINQLEQNQSDTTVKKTLRVSLRQLARANRDSARAGKLIGMKL